MTSIPLPNSRLGILFPSYLANFIDKFETDARTTKKYNSKNTVYQPLVHQKFIKAFFHPSNPYQSMLLYHGLGTGKTCTSLFNYDSLFSMNKEWRVYILIKKSLEGTWKSAFASCLTTKDQKAVDNIHFVIYDAYNVADKFESLLNDEPNNGVRCLFIIDETHNFISNVVSNIHHAKHKARTPALNVYRKIQETLRTNSQSRMLCITATPAINDPYELGILFNLLHPSLFPENYDTFYETFVDPAGGLKKKHRNVFQRRILDKVSFVMPSNPDDFATRLDYPPVLIPMSPYQQKHYTKYHKIEKKRKEWMGDTQYGEGTFNIYTRQACNFVFPNMNEKYNAQSRRAAGTKYNVEVMSKLSVRQKEEFIKNEEISKYDGQTKRLKSKDQKRLKLNEKLINTFVEYLLRYWDELETTNRTSIEKDIDSLHEIVASRPNDKHQEIVEDFINNHVTSAKLKSMIECSRKMTHIALMCCISIGITIVYSSWVRGEGLQLFEIYLQQMNIRLGSLDTPNPTNGGIRYLKFTGELDNTKRFKAQEIVNKPSNKRGDGVKILLLSAAGAEGISIMNCREVHLMEPYWHEVRSQQVVGRGIRQGSHKALPKSDHNVAVYRYLSTINNLTDTMDQIIYESARKKQSGIDDFLGAMRETAVDCRLFHESNSMHPDIEAYRCFDFSDETKLRPDKGYAYRNNLEEDILLENKGYGSENAEVVKIRVKVIKGKVLSKVVSLLLDEDKGYCYDAKTKKLVGTTKNDEFGQAEMIGIGVWKIQNIITF